MTLFEQSTLEAESSSQRDDRVTAEHVIDAGADGLRPTWSTSSRRSLRARWSASRTPTSTAASSWTPTLRRPWWATRSTACWTGGRRGVPRIAEQGRGGLSEDAAAGLGAELGEPVDLRLGDGVVHQPTVVAVDEKSLGLRGRPAAVGLAGRPPDDPCCRLWLRMARIRSRQPPRSARCTATTRRRWSEARRSSLRPRTPTPRPQAWVNYMLLGLVIAFAAFALLNTLMLAIRDRSREYALLQLIGASRRQVRRMMRVEGLMLVLIGWAIGGAVAATTLMPFARAVTGFVATRCSRRVPGGRAPRHRRARVAGDHGPHPRDHEGPARGRHRDQGVTSCWDRRGPGPSGRRGRRAPDGSCGLRLWGSGSIFVGMRESRG